jgi:hypothetical protein
MGPSYETLYYYRLIFLVTTIPDNGLISAQFCAVGGNSVQGCAYV